MEVKDILQINATIIAGAFIFLSLSIGLLSESETELEDREQEQERLLNQTNANANATSQPMSESIIRFNSQAVVAFLISVPFAMSSFMAVNQKIMVAIVAVRMMHRAMMVFCLNCLFSSLDSQNVIFV
jgi:hypothetical protein